jgi:hypothetical protein
MGDDIDREVLEAADWWHAEVNRTRSTSPFHVALEEFEDRLFKAVSARLNDQYQHATTQTETGRDE